MNSFFWSLILLHWVVCKVNGPRRAVVYMTSLTSHGSMQLLEYKLHYVPMFQYCSIGFYSKYTKNCKYTKQKKKLDAFYFSVISWYLWVRHIIDSYLLFLYMCNIRTCFPLDWAFKILFMLQKHVLACFAREQLCISSFASKLLCRHTTLIAKVNSCINFNFCILIIMLYLSKIRGILKLWFFVPTLTSTNTLDVRF